MAGYYNNRRRLNPDNNPRNPKSKTLQEVDEAIFWPNSKLSGSDRKRLDSA